MIVLNRKDSLEKFWFDVDKNMNRLSNPPRKQQCIEPLPVLLLPKFPWFPIIPWLPIIPG